MNSVHTQFYAKISVCRLAFAFHVSVDNLIFNHYSVINTSIISN